MTTLKQKSSWIEEPRPCSVSLGGKRKATSPDGQDGSISNFRTDKESPDIASASYVEVHGIRDCQLTNSGLNGVVPSTGSYSDMENNCSPCGADETRRPLFLSPKPHPNVRCRKRAASRPLRLACLFNTQDNQSHPVDQQVGELPASFNVEQLDIGYSDPASVAPHILLSQSCLKSPFEITAVNSCSGDLSMARKYENATPSAAAGWFCGLDNARIDWEAEDGRGKDDWKWVKDDGTIAEGSANKSTAARQLFT